MAPQPRKQIKRSTNLADLIQDSGLVGTRGKQGNSRAKVRPKSAPGRRKYSQDENDNMSIWLGRGERLSQSTSTSTLHFYNKEKFQVEDPLHKRPKSAQELHASSPSRREIILEIPSPRRKSDAEFTATAPGLQMEKLEENQKHTSASHAYAWADRPKRSVESKSIGVGIDQADPLPIQDESVKQNDQEASEKVTKRYMKLKLLATIIDRLEKEIDKSTQNINRNISQLEQKHEDMIHRSEKKVKIDLKHLGLTFERIEKKCRSIEQEVIHAKSKSIEEMKFIKYEKGKIIIELETNLKAERKKLKDMALKQKELLESLHKAENANHDKAKLGAGNLEKVDRREKFLMKELNQTIDALHEAQKKCKNLEDNMQSLKAQLTFANKKMSNYDMVVLELEELKYGEKESLERRATAEMTLDFDPKALQIEEYEKQVAALQKEVKRLKEENRHIRAEEMAMHSRTLSELEERLQHSESMGLQARISSSHVVKRIKDLLLKVFSSNSAKSQRPIQDNESRHMDDIKDELTIIFDNYAALGEKESVSEEDHLEAEEKTGSNREEFVYQDESTLIEERESLIAECTEYSKISAEETLRVSKITELEVDLLETKSELRKSQESCVKYQNKVKALERDCEETKSRLSAAELKVVDVDKRFKPLGEYEKIYEKAKKLAISSRSMKDELARQRSSALVATRERDEKEIELVALKESKELLEKKANKLSEEWKSLNLQLKHIRQQYHNVKESQNETIAQIKNRNLNSITSLDDQVKKLNRKLDKSQEREKKLKEKVNEMAKEKAVFCSDQEWLRLKLNETNSALEQAKHIIAKQDEELKDSKQESKVARANLAYFKSRQEEKLAKLTSTFAQQQTSLSHEVAFNIVLGDIDKSQHSLSE